MSRFYLTLPSNSLVDYYPQNTVAQYYRPTTNLTSSIELDDEWEVGLTEISFPFNIENVVERERYFRISNPEFDGHIKIPLHSGRYSEIKKLQCYIAKR